LGPLNPQSYAHDITCLLPEMAMWKSY